MRSLAASLPFVATALLLCAFVDRSTALAGEAEIVCGPRQRFSLEDDSLYMPSSSSYNRRRRRSADPYQAAPGGDYSSGGDYHDGEEYDSGDSDGWWHTVGEPNQNMLNTNDAYQGHHMWAVQDEQTRAPWINTPGTDGFYRPPGSMMVYPPRRQYRPYRPYMPYMSYRPQYRPQYRQQW